MSTKNSKGEKYGMNEKAFLLQLGQPYTECREGRVRMLCYAGSGYHTALYLTLSLTACKLHVLSHIPLPFPAYTL